MLSLILMTHLAGATPSRTSSTENLRSACLRSEVHQDPDKRRQACDCIARTIQANRGLSASDLEYLAKTWAEPGSQVTPAPAEADVLEDYDEDVTESCLLKVNAKPKGQSRKR